MLAACVQDFQTLHFQGSRNTPPWLCTFSRSESQRSPQLELVFLSVPLTAVLVSDILHPHARLVRTVLC